MSDDDRLDLLQLAQQVVGRARELGAEEVSATVHAGSHVTIQRRGGKVEQATEASTRGLVVSVLADQRYTSNSTSDLRPEALDPFLKRCVEASRYLEPDPYRGQPDAAECGRGVSVEQLDQDDPAWVAQTAADRTARAVELEAALAQRSESDVISSSCYVADGRSEVVRVLSNGFADRNAGAWFAQGGDMTLEEGDKRPESAAYYAVRHLSDLPTAAFVADEIVARTRERLGAKAIASGAYPMLLANRCVGRLLGVLAGPMAGSALYDHRSCLEGKLGQRIGSSVLNLVDDPTLPRALGSRPWDGDCKHAAPRTLIEQGVLKQYNIGVYHGRKLECPPTSSGRSNWVLPAGDRSPLQIASELPAAIRVTGFLGGNSNAATGDFSFGIRGQLLEHGEPVQALSEMNVTGNVLQIFDQLVEAASDPWTFSSVHCPTLLFTDVQFSGT